jgi:hypothetical protein
MVKFPFPDGNLHLTLGGLEVCKGLLKRAVEVSKLCTTVAAQMEHNFMEIVWKFLFSDCEEYT